MEYYHLDLGPTTILHIIVLISSPSFIWWQWWDLLELGEASKIIGKVRLEYHKQWC